MSVNNITKKNQRHTNLNLETQTPRLEGIRLTCQCK